MSTVTVIPLERFGRDHWSTFAYLETRVVDARGIIDKDRMRTDPDRHPGLIGPRVMLLVMSSREKYPTRLRDGELLSDHDDWDCMDDLERVGLLVTEGTGIQPLVKLTDEGRRIAAALRAHIATKRTTGSAYDTFDVSAVSK